MVVLIVVVVNICQKNYEIIQQVGQMLFFPFLIKTNIFSIKKKKTKIHLKYTEDAKDAGARFIHL